LDNQEYQLEQKKLDDTIKNIEDRTYYVWELLENKKNQFKERTNTIGDEIAYQSGKKEANLLSKAYEEPYFGRFDIDSKDYGNETFYIGKQGVKNKDEDIVVVDWRMPIASVYYNFIPGKPWQKYMVENEKTNRKETFHVQVSKKREFTIENRKLKRIVQQVASTTSPLNKTYTDKGEQLDVTDDFLREILEKSETTGYLKEIIATIQQEQNIAIRQPIDKNVIIQGVAGSGKSSIALHRLSYLLFNNKKIKPEDVLIIGPSKMFLSSFQGLLPELNLEGIKQSTFQQLVQKYIGSYVKHKIDPGYSDYFETVLFKQGTDLEKKRIEFKGSENFALMIDIFLQEFKQKYPTRFNQIQIFGTTLFTEDLEKIFAGYAYLPFSKQIVKFFEHVEKQFKEQLDRNIEDLKGQYEFITTNYFSDSGLTDSNRQSLMKQMKDIYLYKKAKMETEFKDSLSAWKKKMEIPDLLTMYNQILSYEVLSAFSNELGDEIPVLFKNYTVNRITYFDLAPLLYIFLSFYEEPEKYVHLIMDEAQDFSFMHFLVLRKLTRTMTILGDKDQSIFLNYGQENWEKVENLIFQDQEDTLLSMNTSYRSTKEIIEVADTVLTNQFGMMHSPITAINRSGPKAGFNMVLNGEDLLTKIKDTIKEWRGKYKRIAIIHKDERKAKKLADYLNNEMVKGVVYINPEEDVKPEFVSVLSSYNCKGMEFDGVILVNINEDSFPKDDLHARLLYVLLTRAQQEIKVFYQDKPSPLLEGCVKPTVKVSSRFDDIL
jgi:DNA helicase II / ATP-dependent DNA helicase PcrA